MRIRSAAPGPRRSWCLIFIAISLLTNSTALVSVFFIGVAMAVLQVAINPLPGASPGARSTSLSTARWQACLNLQPRDQLNAPETASLRPSLRPSRVRDVKVEVKPPGGPPNNPRSDR